MAEKSGGKRPRDLKEALKGKLTKKEMRHLISSFDSVGDIAVIQVPELLEHKAKVIGTAVLLMNKHFRTVCMVTGKHKGKYRVQPVKVIAGKRNKAATYRESGCTFKVDLGKVFFSPRLSTERLRIARLIKPGEVVGAFFAGVGPFPIVFAKNSPMGKAFAIELNPVAFRQMQENIELNKVAGKVEAVKGDVRKVVPKTLAGKCDRVVMPLPEGAESFLGSALLALKEKGGVVHFYRFVEKSDSEKPLREIRAAAEKAGMRWKVLFRKKVRSFSATKEQVVVDFFAKGA
ncbi:MAG: class I SAM-dependent methyltransferase family protein [Candidatus Diapherotrites archaeon]|nr:class I SAM-dependent methyltransferase family protein [Candidatus Diapherotrites archaeon]